METPGKARIVFFGTAAFGVPALTTLLENHYPVAAIVTVPDKPAGRGQQINFSPIKKFALGRGLKILQPAVLRAPEFTRELKELKADLFVVVAFRILPVEVFTMPRLGSFNLHASLLPQYRGAAPINWAIIRGEKVTGVTTFFLQEKVDTGSLILQEQTPIGPDETAGEVHDRLSEIGAQLTLETVRLVECGKAAGRAQNEASASPAPKLSKEDCRIDWTKGTQEVHDHIRGLSPRPCAFTYHNGTILKVYRTKISPGGGSEAPGDVLDSPGALLIRTGDGAVEILEIQQEGKKRLGAGEFLRGYRLRKGDRLS